MINKQYQNGGNFCQCFLLTNSLIIVRELFTIKHLFLNWPGDIIQFLFFFNKMQGVVLCKFTTEYTQNRPDWIILLKTTQHTGLLHHFIYTCVWTDYRCDATNYKWMWIRDRWTILCNGPTKDHWSNLWW